MLIGEGGGGLNRGFTVFGKGHRNHLFREGRGGAGSVMRGRIP